MKRAALLILVLNFLTVSFSTSALAHEYRIGQINIDHPWSRPTPPGTTMGVGYLTITNSGGAAITLIHAQSPAAEKVTIHETLSKNGLMRMQPLKEGLRIPAGETVELKPHSYHLMLEKLKGALEEGQQIPLTLVFDGGREVRVELLVEPLDGIGQRESPASKQMDSHDHP